MKAKTERIVQIIPAPAGLRAFIADEETNTATDYPVVGLALIGGEDALGEINHVDYLVAYGGEIEPAMNIPRFIEVEFPEVQT